MCYSCTMPKPIKLLPKTEWSGAAFGSPVTCITPKKLLKMPTTHSPHIEASKTSKTSASSPLKAKRSTKDTSKSLKTYLSPHCPASWKVQCLLCQVKTLPQSQETLVCLERGGCVSVTVDQYLAWLVCFQVYQCPQWGINEMFVVWSGFRLCSLKPNGKSSS